MTDDVQCVTCGGWCCQGCLDQADLDKLNQEIVERAQARLVSPIVSKPYEVERKKSVPLDVGPYIQLNKYVDGEEAKDIMNDNAEILAIADGYSTLKNVSNMENLKDIHNTDCWWNKRRCEELGYKPPAASIPFKDET